MAIIAKGPNRGSREIITFALSRAFGQPELAMQASTMIGAGTHTIQSVCASLGFDAARTEEIDLLYRSSMLGMFCAERLRERIEPIRVHPPKIEGFSPMRLRDTLTLVETAKQAATAVATVRGDKSQVAELEPLASAFNRAQALCRRSGISINSLLKVVERTNGWVTKGVATDEHAQGLVFKQARVNEVNSAKLMAIAATESNGHVKAVVESLAVLAAKTASYFYASVQAEWVPNVEVRLYRDRTTNQVLDQLHCGRDGVGDAMQRQTIGHLTSIPIGPTKDDHPTSDALVGAGGNEFMSWQIDTMRAAQQQTRQEWEHTANLAEAAVVVALRQPRPKAVAATI